MAELKTPMSQIMHSISDRQDGIGVLELLLVLTLVAILSTFAIIGINRSRASLRLQNSTRIFAGRVEKARLDAVRRHSATSIDISGPNSYDIFMDFDGNGVPSTRRFTLENGVVFTDANKSPLTVDGSGNVSSPNGNAVPWADFDFRGRTTECTMLFRLLNSNTETSTLQVMGSGDVTINTAVSNPAAISYSTVNPTNDVVTTATVKGAKLPLNLSPCGTSSGSSGSPVVVGTGSSGCQIQPSVGLVTIRRNGGSTATLNIIVNSAGTITASPNSNLAVSPATRSVTNSSGGTFAFTISSITKSRGIFPVSFSSPCSSTSVQAKVTN